MMKIKLYIAVVAAFILSACQALNFDNIVGQPIRFRATMADNGLTTRTIYSGEGDSSDGLFKERIKWTTGDDVIVYMDWEQVSGVSAIPDPDANHYYYYNVSPADNGNPEYIHHGTLSAKDEQAGKSLTWKGDKDKNVIFNHYFYSVYPATCAAGGSAGINYKNPNDVSFTFTLPSNNADNMRYAYMAALAEAVQTNHTGKDGSTPYYHTIDLKYYPMITTLYVTLVNESNRAEGEITVSISPTEENKRNSRNPLYGEYTVKLDKNKGFDEYYNNEIFYDKETVAFDNNNAAYGTSSYTYVFNDETLENVEGKQYISIPFFVRPREYDFEDIVLTVGNQDFHLNYEFKPFRKYNITVKLNDPSSKPEPPDIKDLEAGGAQILAMLIKNLLSNTKTSELLNKYYSSTDPNYFNNHGYWNAFDKLLSNDHFDDITIKDIINAFADEALGVDGADMLNVLLEYIRKTTIDASIKLSPDLSHDVSAKELQMLLPNAKSIDLQISETVPADRRPVTVEVEDLPNLESLYIHHPQKVVVKGCENLTSLILDNAGSLFTGLYMENCGLSSFSFESANAPDAVLEFKDMSELTNIKVAKAKEVKATSCPKLITVSHNKDFGSGPSVTITDCPSYTGETEY